MIPKRPTRIGITLLDDAGFDAAFGALGIPGRDEAHWRLLADAVAADLAESGCAPLAVTLPPLDIEPPTRLRVPRFLPPPRLTRVAAITAALALAALALFALRTPERGDPAVMVPRGIPDADLVAPLDLAVAVKTGAGTARFDANMAYAVGDTLVFQVTLPAPATVELRRKVGTSEALLWSGSLPAGHQTLPAGYTLDVTDRGLTTFTVRAVTPSGTLDRSVVVHSGWTQ